MRDYKHIEVTPITGILGAEIAGVDLTQTVSDAALMEIEQAFGDHAVIVFRDQAMGFEDQKRFTRMFGEFGFEPYVKTMPDHPEIIEVIKEASESGMLNFGGNWHSDWSFQEAPPRATILHAKDIPPYGGDTAFANMYAAYETLSQGMRDMLDGLNVVHSARRPYGTEAKLFGREKRAMTIINSEEAHAEQVHPAVRTVPETGRKALFINPVYAIRFENMTERESRPLLDFLNTHATRIELTCRVRWQVNTLVMWDNRCVQHNAMNDYDGFRRQLHRTTVAGERPYLAERGGNGGMARSPAEAAAG
ncbi:TauD/TfdA dioxygenase family protein [Minwuia sp.]|uniref:TauD/TfdA dioxygenase family protein n=1 Tax=Minwuia sp. TaxID=2493630 RepID=UPI003A8CBAE7